MMTRTLPFAILVATLVSLSACVKTPTVGFENDTQDKIILRASVDEWHYVTDCDTGRDRGAINRQGNFSMEPNTRICMRVEGRKDALPAGELVSQVDVIRSARRCASLNRDQIIDGQTKSRGFSVFKIDDAICPPEELPPVAPADDEADDNAEDEDQADQDDINDDDQDD